MLLLAVDGTVLSLPVLLLSADLTPSVTELICDVSSFALAGLLVTVGSLGDCIGFKRLLLIGAAGFGLGSSPRPPAGSSPPACCSASPAQS